MAKQPKLSTLRSNISHIRKMLNRLKKTHFSLPSKNYVPPTKVVQSGSRLKIDGKVYTPAELDKLIGKNVDWRVDVETALQQKLKEQTWELERRTGGLDKRGKPLKPRAELTDREKDWAHKGVSIITKDAKQAVRDWLNSGSDGWKKNLYYHEMGYTGTTDGEVMSFLANFDIDFYLNYEETYKALQENIGE